MVHNPVDYKAPVSRNLLSCEVIDKLGSKQLFFLDNPVENETADDKAVSSNDEVQEYEEDKPAIVVEPYTLVEPDAVVVELLNADVAHAAVLRPSWLEYIARPALLFSLEYYPIELESPQSFVVRVFCDHSRITIAS